MHVPLPIEIPTCVACAYHWLLQVTNADKTSEVLFRLWFICRPTFWSRTQAEWDESRNWSSYLQGDTRLGVYKNSQQCPEGSKRRESCDWRRLTICRSFKLKVWSWKFCFAATKALKCNRHCSIEKRWHPWIHYATHWQRDRPGWHLVIWALESEWKWGHLERL